MNNNLAISSILKRYFYKSNNLEKFHGKNRNDSIINSHDNGYDHLQKRNWALLILSIILMIGLHISIIIIEESD